MKKTLVSAFALLAVTLSLLTAAPSAAATTPKSVCIDPGHGGSDTGTSNGTGAGQILEKDLNLEVAKLVGGLLLNGGYGGYGVSYTRTDDRTLSNTERAQICNKTSANILVSVHHNGSSDHAVDYSQALYQKRVDHDLARAIVDAVSSSSSGLNTTNKGIAQFASGVLIKSDMPATISEGFFLTSTNEYNLLTSNGTTAWRDSSRLHVEAQAIYNGIVAYLGPAS